ncbi:mitochondrial carrier [Fomitopsis serialis]|uniref:mitochondrial carrier n=1 Tax=Fomitopsis serialis TaxID=139415 RepID=UPI002007CF11|nr:mitochondrial carrier [Neoantrodia serialis]KAH9919100.1 mitochondrial carrier [Neoantrodia serialis]
MTSAPTSLRDYYAAPSNAWSFIPASLPGSPENSTDIYSPATSSSSYEWSTRTNTNPLFDLSATYASAEDGFDVKLVAQGLVTAALSSYASQALTMPFEVGKTLLQVQWVPRDIVEAAAGVTLSMDPMDEEEELSDTSIDNDAYFADPSKIEAEGVTPPPPRLADERGYVVRQSVLDEGATPEYIMPVGLADGTWGMIKQLGRFRSEGWLSLWKGLLTTTVHEALYNGLQPSCHTILQYVLSPMFPSLSSASSSLLLPVASHTLAGFILSPLQLVRTRLIIQSANPRFRTYSGPIDALSQILAHEGGLHGVYLHPHLLIPTLLEHTLRGLIPLTLPALIASYIGFGTHLSPDMHPVLWNVSELLGDFAGSLIMLPIETIRRRLQAQTRGTAKPLRACVEMRPAPYNGVVDALWHIITEERSDRPVRTHARRKSKGKAKEGAVEEEEKRSWLGNTGIGQLYRGLGVRLAVGFTVFVLASLSDKESDGGWAEL